MKPEGYPGLVHFASAAESVTCNIEVVTNLTVREDIIEAAKGCSGQ